MTSTQAPDLELRIANLEAELATLKAELDRYRRIFAAAVSGPVARQVLSTLGIKLPPELL